MSTVVAWICGLVGFATPLLAWALLHGSKKLNGREPDDAQDFDDAPLDPDLALILDNRNARFIPTQPCAPHYPCTCATATRKQPCLDHWPFGKPL